MHQGKSRKFGDSPYIFHPLEVAQILSTMTDDEEIITLRSSIRKAAESKLSHGIIDVNDLVKEINSENAARLQQSLHEIQMLKEIYDLRYAQGDALASPSPGRGVVAP